MRPMTRAFRLALATRLASAVVLAGASLLWALTASPAVGSTPPTASGDAGLPPLLDRELFFGNPEIAAAQISPDGQWVAFLKPWNDTRNIWIKKRGESYAEARRLTAESKRPIPALFWSRDSKYVLFVKDHEGDENFNVYALEPGAGPAPGQETPLARNLTDAKGARAAIYSLPKPEPDVLYVGLNDRDAAWHDLYRVRISTGERTLLKRNDDRISSWHFDLTGRLRLASRILDSGDTEVLKVTDKGFEPVYTCGVFESCGPQQFHKDGKRVYLRTNKGEKDLIRLVLLDPETRREEFVEEDPLGRVDFEFALFSPNTDELVATGYVDERLRIYFRDKGYEADHDLIQGKLADKEITLASATADDTVWMISATSDTDPGSRYLYDRKTKSLTLEYVSRERVPREHMAPMQAIRYRSSDGLEIPAYLTLPRGVPARGLPLIVHPHGGPWARDTWGFSGIAQFYANRGYAVLQPNFRGSTGYGKTFLNSGNRQWGDLMQDDLTWGVKHLVAEGTVDPKRVGIMGGSYGGYATLAGVAFTPEVYSAAVSLVGPSNLITLLDSIPPYWEALRIIFHHRMGDPRTEEGKKQLVRQSPLSAAKHIRTPLLIAQGANDPRVKRTESEQIVIALRDREFPVEYILAPDEGHGFARPVNNMAFFAATEAFLARHLAGRHQKDMPVEVASRLDELTVDPSTVVLAKLVDPSAVGAPKPALDLAAGTFTYQGTLAASGQNMPVTVTRTIEDQGGSWVVTSTAKLPMGESVDRTTVAKGTLLVTGRSVKQGPASIEITCAQGKAEGTISVSGTPKPMTVDLGGDLFADGAASEATLSRLPLAEGYSATYRNLDLMRQKVALKQVKVVGMEDVTVPAGSFKTWKVEISSAEGEPGSTTLWIAADTRAVVKSSATLPQMGGATLTAELQP